MNKFIKLSNDVILNPSDISSIEKYEKWDTRGSISNEDHYLSHSGTIVVLKNGHKLYIKDTTPEGIFSLIQLKGGK